MTYLEELGRELTTHGIRGSTRCRILAEVIDHLDCDPAAEDRFGSPQEIANEFAAQLGAQRTRRAAVWAFAALGIAGAVYATCFVSLAFAGPPTEALAPALGALAFALTIVAPQVSFVAGGLALVRAVRRRRDRVLPTQELVAIRRRTTVALTAGLVTMGALALYAFEYRATLEAWWTTLVFAATAVASSLLVAAVVPAAGSARLKPQVAGDAGDVFDDVGIDRLRTDPWRFARLVALAVGVAVWLAGIVQGDPIDGLIRGALEAAACLAGFAALGRYLGLRR
jgi:hypothetical protein